MKELKALVVVLTWNDNKKLSFLNGLGLKLVFNYFIEIFVL